VAVDPWMSRPMRHHAGLPLPEQRIGHAAHDLAGLLCAPQVILTRAAKVDGTPAVPSRWLLRLETVLKAVGLPELSSAQPWVRWAEALDQPATVTPISRPEPRPPVADRPRKLSVTRVETWMRDPYAIYAQFILGLKALDPLDEDPGASDYGNLVHGALELFQRTYPDDLPAAPVEALLTCGRQIFEQHIARPAVWAFWWPRFESLAKWVIEQEIARRPLVHETHVEIKGTLALENFTLTAEADRIDLKHDGSLAIIDYKTGAPPKAKEVAAGFSPQLPLEALIAREGGFPGVPSGRPISELVFWHVKGGEDGGLVSPALAKRDKTLTVDDLIAQALDGLKGLVMAFDHRETPYLARPHPEHLPAYSDYLHLARVREWSAGEGDSE
jgi:ATP-dependent helicase/nuclease subunit B